MVCVSSRLALTAGPTDSMALNMKSYGDSKETKGAATLSSTATAAQLSAALSLGSPSAPEVKDFNYGGTAAEYRSDAGVSSAFCCPAFLDAGSSNASFRQRVTWSVPSKAPCCCAIASRRRTWRAPSRSRRCSVRAAASTTARSIQCRSRLVVSRSGPPPLLTCVAFVCGV